ncbi:helix-turn-helix transcriptional regulator [Ramlibacter solisilvae]|uniref:HTH luxR-type domain-containing protein n=1 Tax=Ramlibacter tataouinensis TaxID=94132 RepID=A0A127JRX6_9BURK|nr:LuxR C-terminal-related transcriptional regulator [Ramlibacter tataouinensis]AMO22731.1 hypothetical protein UC35_07345 [Ramlibacter tataouinensis]
MNFDKLFISTKFAPPQIGARYIHRGHLLELLRSEQRCTLALITGSAGFGKTVLLAQWRQELIKNGDEVSWLSLSHDDKDLATFCAYLLAALRRLGIPVEDDALLDGDIGKSTDVVVAAIVNAAAASSSSKDLYLIVDDYHHVSDQRAHGLMQKLIDHCPPNLHVVIASRTTPPLTVSRLRVLGRLAEVGFSELPFNLEETRSFFDRNLGAMKLGPDEVRLIHDKTSGWPASLELMAIMLRTRPETRTGLRQLGGNSSELQAYLAEDVLAHLPAASIDFMEQTSVCRRFNADLAQAVTGQSNAAELIQQAEEQNLFIYRVEFEDDLLWYRFHPLFGDLLFTRLKRRGRAVVEQANRRASRWFADRGLLIEAVRHAIHGGDLDFAVGAIENAAPATWSLSYIRLMLNLLERVPQETLHAHPNLFFLACLSFAFSARPAEGERWIAKMRESEAATIPAISSKLPLVDGAVALHRDDSRRALDLLEPMRDQVFENRFLRHSYLVLMMSAYSAVGRYADAYRLLDQNPIAPEDRLSDMAILAEATRASLMLQEGNAREGARLITIELARSISAHGRQSACADMCAATLADAYYELDRIDDARETVSNRVSILRSAMPSLMISAALCHARLDGLQESPDKALAFLDWHAAHYHSLGLDRPVAYMLAEQVRVLLQKGDRARAADLSARLNGLGERHANAEGLRAEIPALAALARARLSLVNSDPEDALRGLSTVRQVAQRYGRGRMVVSADILSALALDYLRRDSEADELLLHVLHAGARFGLVRTFVDEGPRVGQLLARLQGHAQLDAQASQYLADLLSRFGGGSTKAPEAVKKQAASARVDPTEERVSLTPREFEILTLISKAMSSKRVAQTLNIAPETVKWNLRNIMAKLRVSSRYDALARARKQGLIE